MRFTYILHGENERTSVIAMAGEAPQCSSLTACTATTSGTSAKRPRGWASGMRFIYRLQYENEPDVSEKATGGDTR